MKGFSWKVIVIALSAMTAQQTVAEEKQGMALPQPSVSGDMSVEEALHERRSIRRYGDAPLPLRDIGQLAWAAQGITEERRGLRTSPSAGATYPLEIYFLITGLEEIPDGLYRYVTRGHRLEKVLSGDRRGDLFESALYQDAIMSAPVVMVITGVEERTARRYGQRATRYVHMEAGHAAQNVSLQAVALGIGTVVIGAFDDSAVVQALRLDEGESPLYLMPLGKQLDNS